MSDFERNMQKLQNRDKRRSTAKKALRILLAPVVFLVFMPLSAIADALSDRRQKRRDKIWGRAEYSDQQAKAFLDRYLPVCFLEYQKYSKLFGEYAEGILLSTGDPHDIQIGPWMFHKAIPKRAVRDQVYWQKFGEEIRKYLLDAYEIPGWSVTRLQNWQDWSRVEQEKDWIKCYDKDWTKGVYFKKSWSTRNNVRTAQNSEEVGGIENEHL